MGVLFLLYPSKRRSRIEDGILRFDILCRLQTTKNLKVWKINQSLLCMRLFIILSVYGILKRKCLGHGDGVLESTQKTAKAKRHCCIMFAWTYLSFFSIVKYRYGYVN